MSELNDQILEKRLEERIREEFEENFFTYSYERDPSQTNAGSLSIKIDENEIEYEFYCGCVSGDHNNIDKPHRSNIFIRPKITEDMI